METVSISHFKAKCLALLEEVERTGKPLLVTKRGKPIAQVLPPQVEAEIPEKGGFGCMAGTIEILGNIVAPLPPQAWGNMALAAIERAEARTDDAA